MNREPIRFDPREHPVSHQLDPRITGRPRARVGDVVFDLDERRCPRCRPDLFPGDVALAAPVCCDGPAIPVSDVDHRAARAYRVFRGWPTESDVRVLALLGQDDVERDEARRMFEERMAEDPVYRAEVEADRVVANAARRHRAEHALVTGEPLTPPR